MPGSNRGSQGCKRYKLNASFHGKGKHKWKIQHVQARNQTEDWNMKGASTVDLKRANQKTLGTIHMRWLTVVSTNFLNEPDGATVNFFPEINMAYIIGIVSSRRAWI